MARELRGIEPPPIDEKFSDSLRRWFNVLTGRFPIHISATIDPTTVNSNTTSEQTFTVTGLGTGMAVFVNKPTHQAGLGVVGARISAKDTLAITFMNTTGSGIDPTSETYQIVAFR